MTITHTYTCPVCLARQGAPVGGKLDEQGDGGGGLSVSEVGGSVCVSEGAGDESVTGEHVNRHRMQREFLAACA